MNRLKTFFLTTLNHNAPIVTKIIIKGDSVHSKIDNGPTRYKILRKTGKSQKDFDWNIYKSLRNQCKNMNDQKHQKRYHTELLNYNANN